MNKKGIKIHYCLVTGRMVLFNNVCFKCGRILFHLIECRTYHVGYKAKESRRVIVGTLIALRLSNLWLVNTFALN